MLDHQAFISASACRLEDAIDLFCAPGMKTWRADNPREARRFNLVPKWQL
jgi:hypothetical protein